MKRYKLAILALITTISFFCSCSNNEDNPFPTQDEIQRHIVGRWKLETKHGERCPTNERNVITVMSNNTSTHSYANKDYATEAMLWFNKEKSRYELKDNILTFYDFEYDGNNPATMKYAITSINDKEMKAVLTELSVGNHLSRPNEARTFTKVYADYSQKIVGTWEGCENTGFETEGDYKHRWEYKADGTYTYYTRSEDGTSWIPDTEDLLDEYVVDGDWLATHWTKTDGSDKYEYWDIVSVDDDYMYWEGFRKEDKVQNFISRFKLRRVK